MQGLARQLNLSETTFVTPPVGEETAAVRIFTPSYEMPFAGHPTLGTAAVVSDLAGRPRPGRAQHAGRADPGGTRDGGRSGPCGPTRRRPAPWPPTRPTSPAWWASTSPRSPDAAPWVDTGTVQMLLPLRSAADVRAASADPVLLRELATRPDQQALVYLWAPREDGDLEARLFFTQDGAVIEDPATGSACANLGGWFHARGERGIRRRIHQGDGGPPPVGPAASRWTTTARSWCPARVRRSAGGSTGSEPAPRRRRPTAATRPDDLAWCQVEPVLHAHGEVGAAALPEGGEAACPASACRRTLS